MSRLALITGSSSGIGAETAHELARRGFRVVLVARDSKRLREVATSIGSLAIAETCDASSGTEIIELASRLRSTIGVPDVIVNCAGAGRWLRIEETPPEEAASMMAAPYLAAFNTTHVFMRDMLLRKSGTLIHVNSPACFFAWPASVGYTAARHALRGLHESLCQDLVGTGVQSCHVVFGRVESPYWVHNPGTKDNIPKITGTIRTLSTTECGHKIADIALRPKRETIHPFMLRFYRWSGYFMPAFVLWLIRVTGSKRIKGVSPL